jgi:MFS family permease
MIDSLARWAPLRSLRVRDFRLLWASDALGSWAEHTEFIVLSWFVLVSTDSPLLVGAFGAVRFVGTLFAPFYGVMADRYNRARLFAGIRTMVTAVTCAVLALAVSGQLSIWYVFILMTLEGIARSGYIVTRQALVADKLPSEALMNGVALNRVAWNAAQLAGPLAGGVMLSRLGTVWAYIPVVALNLTASLLAYLIRPVAPSKAGSATSVWSNLNDSFRYIGKNQVILALLLMALLVNFAAFPLNNGLMPVFARNVLGSGPTGLATLLAAYAASALVGSLFIAVLKGLARPGRFLLVATLAWHLGLLAFAGSRWFGVSVAILLATGVAQSFSMVTIGMLLLNMTSPEMRGRVMGARALAVYSLPLGLLISGALADVFGAPLAMAVFAMVGVLFTALIAVWLRRLWRVA